MDAFAVPLDLPHGLDTKVSNPSAHFCMSTDTPHVPRTHSCARRVCLAAVAKRISQLEDFSGRS